MLRIQVRYSLRTLLVAMIVMPAGIYWLSLPTLNARRLAAALERRDYGAAEQLLMGDVKLQLVETKDYLSFSASANIEQLSLADLFRARQRLTYHWQAHMGSWVMTFSGRECVSTRRGIAFVPEDK